MILNSSIFTATIAAAKTAAANRPDVLRAIDRAASEIEKASYWSFDAGVLTIKSTTSGELYRVDANHACPARSKVCKHIIARLLMVRYNERLSNAEPVPAIVVRESARGFRVRPPYKHSLFVRAFKATVGGRWYADSGEWFIPVEKLNHVIELLGDFFKQPVVIECAAAPDRVAPVATVADERAVAVEKIERVWLRGPVRYDLSRWLVRRFGVNQLSMLTDTNLQLIAAAIR